MSGCCGCMQQFPLWEQMLKAYKYMSEILSVTHTYKDPADGNRKLSKMDISRLEEQYYGIKQKQKLQTHIIVFKAGENEFIPKDTTLDTVPVNKRVQHPKAFNEQIHVKEVALELLDNNYLKDRNGTWHAHLNIHRMVQIDCHYNLGERTAAHKQHNDKSFLFKRFLSSDHQPSKDSEEDVAGQTETSGLAKDNKPVNSPYRKSSLQHPIPISWGHYEFPSSKPSSPTEKLFFYPFPQKKSPRISETARKLGLYVTH